jgi:hypothetical protein
MKKYGVFLVCLVMSLAAMSQKAVISFDEKNHDFGKINEEDGKVTHVFEFKNKGATPLVVNSVQASCGCTTPTWTKEPIEPGKSGSITVTYNPAGRPGAFTKTITVRSNSTEEEVILIIKGEVIPKQSSESNPYPVNMNGLVAKSRVVQMNNVDKGKNQVRTFEIKNSTNSIIKTTVENLPTYLTASVSPETLKPNEEGKITFTLNSKNCTQWGPINDDVFVVVNGQKKFSNDYRLTITSNIIEDFSKMTLDQKRKAPILEIPQKVANLGVVKVGSKRLGKFKINNKGQSALEIRRIINNNNELVIRQSKLSIAGGRTADIIFDLNAKNLSAGDYKKSITIQTNDPDNSFMILVMSWSVQK